MADANLAETTPPPTGLAAFLSSALGRQLILTLGVAAIGAAMAGIWLWGQEPEYRVLLSNFTDRDGGAIVSELQKMNIPYKYADGGGAILVPATQVHDARLKLAAQGLPKGGNVGFELMTNQKMGVSQFLEQVNFQRALEGELARSIESIGSIQSVRVHLALPKPTVFTREQQKPTASVLINLHPGRTLDHSQVNAIIHLVASSVPELHPKGITVVDQNGDLLSEPQDAQAANGPNPTQLKYIQEVQRDIIKRIESILTPIVGAGNVRAEATAEVDFSHSEQAAETYKPNPPPDQAAIRSQQTSESLGGGNQASGIPGALSNQPQAPNPSNAPINPQQTDNTAQPGNTATPSQKESTTHFEVDKTVQYIQRPMGGLKRLTVAVVVNYRKPGDKPEDPPRPLTDAESKQLNDLVKEAMGYSKDRGDSLSVVYSPFLSPPVENIPELPWWKQPANIELAIQAARYLLLGIVLYVIYRRALRPLLIRLDKIINPEPPAVITDKEEAVEDMLLEQGLAMPSEQIDQLEMAPAGVDEEMWRASRATKKKRRNYDEALSNAREVSRKDPRMVAQIIQSWMGTKNEDEESKDGKGE